MLPPRPALVLASTSPYRRELLARLSLPFEVASPVVDESALPGETPDQLAERLAELKARTVAKAFPNALIIGSDQVAYCGQTVFGKPLTHDNAVRQLETMSGRTVTFATAICLVDASTGRARERIVDTRVTFRLLTRERIERYLQIEKPYNCAGSAKSEGLGIGLIAAMECTDPTALVGLPLIALCDLLESEGIRPF